MKKLITLVVIVVMLILTVEIFARQFYTLGVYSRGAWRVEIESSTGTVITNQRIEVGKNKRVTLTAPLYWNDRIFRSWSGAVSSTERTIYLGKTCISKSVTANYVRLPDRRGRRR